MGVGIKYFGVVFIMVLFMVLYVWQNIEMMWMKMDFSKVLGTEKRLVIENDRLRYEIEKFRRLDTVIKKAEASGMKSLTPMDFETIEVHKNKYK